MKHSLTFAMISLMAGLALAPAAQAEGEGPEGGKRGGHLMMLDLDGDGRITRAEVDGAREARFARADADGSGALSLEEMTARAVADATQRAEQRFARLDADGDGQVSKAEMEDKRSERMEKRAMRMFDRVDANDDDVLDEEEIARAMKHHGKKQKDGTEPKAE
ncbi:EF-hand domain-containing protein [Roseovarius aquimarinus]|uniref:EF-hand domain-containing protein n=1 Tax=Roseovarius aquimarinus TaxID=1229156 RepID=A0ABW7IAG1_9RHOB